MIDYAVVPERTALVNIDMQNCFVEGADDGVVALDRINWLAGLCRDAGILVVHTRHVQRPDGSDMGTACSTGVPRLPPYIRASWSNHGMSWLRSRATEPSMARTWKWCCA